MSLYAWSIPNYYLIKLFHYPILTHPYISWSWNNNIKLLFENFYLVSWKLIRKFQGYTIVSLQEWGDCTWRMSDCEELVRLDQEIKYETLWQVLMHKCIKNYKGTPRGEITLRKWPNKDLFSRKRKNFWWFSCDTPVTLAYKKGGKRGITGEDKMYLTC